MTLDHESHLLLPAYRREPADGQPPLDTSGYASTRLRHPTKPLVVLPQRLTEVTGPLFGEERVRPGE
ncbi:MAG TPA: protocatechuate 3,4-dioxygenase subunit beta, partial [Pseudonocardiaceae bacterium]